MSSSSRLSSSRSSIFSRLAALGSADLAIVALAVLKSLGGTLARTLFYIVVFHVAYNYVWYFLLGLVGLDLPKLGLLPVIVIGVMLTSRYLTGRSDGRKKAEENSLALLLR